MDVIGAIARARRWTIQHPLARWSLLILAIAYTCADTALGTQDSILGFIAVIIGVLVMPWREGVELIDEHPVPAGIIGFAAIPGAIWGEVIADRDDVLSATLGVLSLLVLACWVIVINMRAPDDDEPPVSTEQSDAVTTDD